MRHLVLTIPSTRTIIMADPQQTTIEVPGKLGQSYCPVSQTQLF